MSHSAHGIIGQQIESKLKSFLKPIHVEVVNESYKHNVPPGAESHFKVVIVSEEFEGKALLERHRVVNHILSEEFRNGLHALSIQAKTPVQWNSDSSVLSTPNCLGGGHAKK